MSELLIAVLVIVVPALVLGVVGVGGKLVLGSLRGSVERLLTSPIAEAVTTLKTEIMIELERIRKDVSYLRSNGREVRERLQQGAVETENIREDIRELSRDLNKHVDDKEAHA